VRVHPVNLVVDPESLGTAATPPAIDIPIPLMVSVMRSGKDTVWYAGEVCGGAPPVVFSVEHSPVFPTSIDFSTSTSPSSASICRPGDA